jgi:rhodanese-related sulfurtransferase
MLETHPVGRPDGARTASRWSRALAALLLGLLAVVLAACGSGTAAGDSDTGTSTLPAEVSVDEAAAMRDDGAFVLDVRQPEEWVEIHIPDATLIPLGELAARVAEVPKDQEILVYCRSGNRSQEGRDILKAAGFENVTSMDGGIKDWAAAGYETVSGP